MSKLYVVGKENKDFNEAKRYYFKGQDALKKGKWIKAIHYFKISIEKHPDYMPAYRELADIYQQHGSIQEANFYIEKALKINPNNPIALFIQGTIYISQGDCTAALEFFQLSQKHGELTWGLAYNIGLCHYFLKNYETSMQFLNNALQIDPTQILPYYLLAKILLKQNRFKMAKELLKQAKRTQPSDQEIDHMIQDILGAHKLLED